MLICTLPKATCRLLPALQVMDGERKARGDGAAEAPTAVEEIFGLKVRGRCSVRSPCPAKHPLPPLWGECCWGRYCK